MSDTGVQDQVSRERFFASWQSRMCQHQQVGLTNAATLSLIALLQAQTIQGSYVLCELLAD